MSTSALNPLSVTQPSSSLTLPAALRAKSSTANTSTASSSAASSAATAAADATGDSALASQAVFLQLLVAQLKNQDPQSPMDGTQFVTQLAQFSTLEQDMQSRADLDQIVTFMTPANPSTASPPAPSSNASTRVMASPEMPRPPAPDASLSVPASTTATPALLS